MTETAKRKVFQSYGSQPTLVVTAAVGLLEEARLYRLSCEPTEREIIARLSFFLDYAPTGDAAADWAALRELADGTHGSGEVRDWKVVNASLPYPGFGSSSEVVLHAFILVRAGCVAEAALFETREEAEEHGLEVCKSYFDCSGFCGGFDEIVELDAENDCSVYVLELTADGGPNGARAVKGARVERAQGGVIEARGRVA